MKTEIQEQVSLRAKSGLQWSKWLLGVCNCNGQPKRPLSRDGCLTVPNENIEMPDLAIYSQVEQFQNGLLPTWNNRDINTVSVPAAEGGWWIARVKVQNLSPTTPAVNALVHYYVSSFGIETLKDLFSTTRTNVEAGAAVLLHSPPYVPRTELRYPPSFHIKIEHPRDQNLVNNQGSQVIDSFKASNVGHSHSIEIPVVNDSNFTRQMLFSVLPVVANHLPVRENDLVASVSPTGRLFAPHEETAVTLNLEVPAFLSEYGGVITVVRSVTVVAQLSTGELIGGTTINVLNGPP